MANFDEVTGSPVYNDKVLAPAIGSPITAQSVREGEETLINNDVYLKDRQDTINNRSLSNASRIHTIENARLYHNHWGIFDIIGSHIGVSNNRLKFAIRHINNGWLTLSGDGTQITMINAGLYEVSFAAKLGIISNDLIVEFTARDTIPNTVYEWYPRLGVYANPDLGRVHYVSGSGLIQFAASQSLSFIHTQEGSGGFDVQPGGRVTIRRVQ